jgi:drug/metabolite transporter (DMT)-like permease
VTVVVLALISAASFGAMTVAIRIGAARGNAATSALAVLVTSFAITAVAAVPKHDLHRTWQFFLAGLLAPGCSQVLFMLSVREAGPSRTSVAVGAAPLIAVAIAFAFLGEPVRVLLVLGALAIVGGGLALASERDRPEHVRVAALGFAAAATVCFAVRDNLVRVLHAHANPEAAAAATTLAGLLVTALWARRPPTRRELGRLAPAGILFGISYLCLFEAYFHGRVSVVSPLVAAESLFGVAFSALLLRHERIGPRLALGALLVVAGGALIGAGR